jgi:hypothetical protein
MSKSKEKKKGGGIEESISFFTDVTLFKIFSIIIKNSKSKGEKTSKFQHFYGLK